MGGLPKNQKRAWRVIASVQRRHQTHTAHKGSTPTPPPRRRRDDPAPQTPPAPRSGAGAPESQPTTQITTGRRPRPRPGAGADCDSMGPWPSSMSMVPSKSWGRQEAGGAPHRSTPRRRGAGLPGARAARAAPWPAARASGLAPGATACAWPSQRPGGGRSQQRLRIERRACGAARAAGACRPRRARGRRQRPAARESVCTRACFASRPPARPRALAIRSPSYCSGRGACSKRPERLRPAQNGLLGP